MKGQDWTNEELEKLREHYGKMINKELQEKYLPNRTENAIRRKASELGITLAQKSAWTEEELEILREYYGKISNERLQRQYLPKRTIEAIVGKASDLGITLSKSPDWTEEELKSLVETFVKIIKKMYWLGVIGFLGTFLDIPVLRLCYLFFLLAIVDFVLSFIIVIRRESTDETTSALKFLFQNIGMLIGIPVIYVRNLFFLPNIRNYKPQTLYNLPFLGCWTVANGGINRETSHSWSICNQRYAYDFFVLENGKTFHGDGKSVSDYFCYGKPVLSPADGIVVEIKNLFEDTPIPEGQEVLCSASDVRGNYIVIQHAKTSLTMV